MKRLARIVLILICIPIVFVLGFYVYHYSNNYKFDRIKKNTGMSVGRKLLGKPDESKYFENETMDVYYYFPMAEARFFYSKKDSMLVRSWRTDAD